MRQSFAIDLRLVYEYFDDCDGFFSGQQNRWRMGWYVSRRVMLSTGGGHNDYCKWFNFAI